MMGRSDTDLPLLRGWRGELAGHDLLDWLRGETTVAVDLHTEAGVRIHCCCTGSHSPPGGFLYDPGTMYVPPDGVRPTVGMPALGS